MFVTGEARKCFPASYVEFSCFCKCMELSAFKQLCVRFRFSVGEAFGVLCVVVKEQSCDYNTLATYFRLRATGWNCAVSRYGKLRNPFFFFSLITVFRRHLFPAERLCSVLTKLLIGFLCTVIINFCKVECPVGGIIRMAITVPKRSQATIISNNNLLFSGNNYLGKTNRFGQIRWAHAKFIKN